LPSVEQTGVTLHPQDNNDRVAKSGRVDRDPGAGECQLLDQCFDPRNGFHFDAGLREAVGERVALTLRPLAARRSTKT
jgi:hypothetical protein